MKIGNVTLRERYEVCKSRDGIQLQCMDCKFRKICNYWGDPDGMIPADLLPEWLDEEYKKE